VPPILTARSVARSFGAQPLFRNLTLVVNDGDRIGLIGPNGAGKSTLLRLLSRDLEPDEGEVSWRKLARVARVEQESIYEAGRSVRKVVEDALDRVGVHDAFERDQRLAATLGRAGFVDFEADAASLSGGWRKRLAIVEALVAAPDVLLLDEPTNHLDLAGVEWLEEMLQTASFASVIVSHDRYFLENAVTDMAEVNKVHVDGILRIKGGYSTFLERREELMAAQAKQRESLAIKVRQEIDWLHHAARARTRKSKARIEKAHSMIGELGAMGERLRTSSAEISLAASDRKSKRLVEIEHLDFAYDARPIFRDLNFIFTNGVRVGICGPNGGGKTTLLRLLSGELLPQSGELRRAHQLRIVTLEQTRQLDPSLTLKEALAPQGDSVIHNGRQVHVASWAERFLFTGEQLNQPVSRLSGGERARVLIARLMLEPADLLLLDEPTNDLDIPTLEVLEDSLMEYEGALALVTHDRYMLDKVSNVILGVDGQGGSDRFADYAQWEQWYEEQTRPAGKREEAKPAVEAPPPKKKKLSYHEAREYATLEERIAAAEAELAKCSAAMEDPTIAIDAGALIAAQKAHEAAQAEVDKLIERWTELEEKLQ